MLTKRQKNVPAPGLEWSPSATGFVLPFLLGRPPHTKTRGRTGGLRPYS